MSDRTITAEAQEEQTKRRSAIATFFVRLVREKPLGLLGAAITLTLLLTGIFADFIAPYGMNETDTGAFLLAPSAEHLLGTDNLGRDVLSRVIHGARISVIVGLSASVISTSVTVLIGLVSGYLGGAVDLVIQRLVDAVMSLPGLILLMVLMAILGTGMVQIIVVIGLMVGIRGSRIIRGAVLDVKENAYVGAARAIGCSTPRILFRHILPNIMAPAIILFTIRVPGAIMLEASLSFLGLGIPAPVPSWGGMIGGQGRNYMFLAPWMGLWPGVALATVVYGVNVFGDAVRDLLDPKLRGGAGRYNAPTKRSKPEPKKKEVA